MSIKNILLLSALLVGGLFVYYQHIFLVPLMLAVIFAYIFSPFVRFLQRKLHIHRIIGVISVYTIIICVVVLVGTLLIHRVNTESLALNQVANSALYQARVQANSLPEWLQPAVINGIVTLRRSRVFSFFTSPTMTPSIDQAISQLTLFFVFIFGSFYFLKDGEVLMQRFVSLLPEDKRIDFEELLKQINAILGSYLRGQLFLVFFVALMLYVGLSIIGVKFALTLAIFSGFAEIVPVVGPILAGTIAVLVVYVTGGAAHTAMPILNIALIVIALYFVIRQFEDYFVIPFVMGRITKLPAFVIFLAVVIGGHMAGVLGMVLAVPFVAVMRLTYPFVKKHLL